MRQILLWVLLMVLPWGGYAHDPDCVAELSSQKAQDDYFKAFQQIGLIPAIIDIIQTVELGKLIYTLSERSVIKGGAFGTDIRRPRTLVTAEPAKLTVFSHTEGGFIFELLGGPEVFKITHDRGQTTRYLRPFRIVNDTVVHEEAGIDFYQVRMMAVAARSILQTAEKMGLVSRLKVMRSLRRLTRLESDQTKMYVQTLNHFANRIELLNKVKFISERIVLSAEKLLNDGRFAFAIAGPKSNLVIRDNELKIKYEIALTPLEQSKVDINLIGDEFSTQEELIYDQRGLHSVPDMTTTFTKLMLSITDLWQRLQPQGPTRPEGSLSDLQERRSLGPRSGNEDPTTGRSIPQQR